MTCRFFTGGKKRKSSAQILTGFGLGYQEVPMSQPVPSDPKPRAHWQPDSPSSDQRHWSCSVTKPLPDRLQLGRGACWDFPPSCVAMSLCVCGDWGWMRRALVMMVGPFPCDWWDGGLSSRYKIILHRVWRKTWNLTNPSSRCLPSLSRIREDKGILVAIMNRRGEPLRILYSSPGEVDGPWPTDG